MANAQQEDRVLNVVPPTSKVLAHTGPVELVWTGEDGLGKEVLGTYETVEIAGQAADEIANRGHLTGTIEYRLPVASAPEPRGLPAQVKADQAAHDAAEAEASESASAAFEKQEAGDDEVVETGERSEPDAPAGDAPEPLLGAPPAPKQQTLIDKSSYQTPPLELPTIDGEIVDKIRAKLGGAVWLERTSEHDVELIRGVKLGQTVILQVECEVGPPVPGYTTNKDGDLDALVLSRTFTVTSIHRMTPEEL